MNLQGPARYIVNVTALQHDELGIYLRSIADALETFPEAVNNFETAFFSFKPNRETCILLQRELANLLDGHKRFSNWVTVGSTSVATLGSVAAIVGTGLLTFGTGGAAAPLLLSYAPIISAGGGVTACLGSMAALGTLINKNSMENSHLKILQCLLNRDEECSGRLLEFVRRTDNITRVIGKFMDYETFDDLADILENVADYNEIPEFNFYAGQIPEPWKQRIRDLSGLTTTEQDILIALLSAILANYPEVFRRILTLFRPFKPIIRKFVDEIDIVLGSFRLASAGFDAGNGVVNLFRCTKPSLKLLLAAGFLTTISLAIDSYKLATTLDDITKGSKSKIAEGLRNCAHNMEVEMFTLDKVYAEIMARKSRRE